MPDPINMPVAFATGQLAAEYVLHGMALCPVAKGSKGPRSRGWNERVNAITDTTVAAKLTEGVGLLHAFSGTMALDIDNDAEAAAWLLARGINLGQLSAAPDAVAINSGRSGKGKLLYRLPQGAAPAETVKVNGPNGMVLEFRCATRDGKSDQDVLPPSIHPDTGSPYQWGGAGDWRNPPTIPAALLSCWQEELLIRRSPANDTNLSDGHTRFVDAEIDNSSLVLARDFPPSDAEMVADHCNIIGEMRATAGQHQTEPEWRACLGVLLHTTQGTAVCHQWSQGHTGYSSAETQRKLGGLERFGPTTCDILGLYRPNACGICPHRSKIKSPIALGVARPSVSSVVSAAGDLANAGLIALPHVMPVAKAMEITNRYFGYTPDWGERGTYFRLNPQGFPVPCSKDEIANAMANRAVQLDNGTHVPLFKFWNGHSARNEVSRVVYAPGCGSIDECGTPILNLYQGLSRKPREGQWTLMRSHLLKVICQGNLKLYQYLLGWMAHLIQRPDAAPGVVVVLRSLVEGVGKTTVVEWLCSMLGRHALMLNDPSQLLTKFNAHLEDKSFVGVNEPSWPGIKDAEAKLKSMITDAFITIERKHGGVYQVPNNLHFMFTTNAEWAVPAGSRARRYLVLDVDPSKAGNRDYFDALYREAANGGIEAMLHVLMSFRLDRFDLRSVPITDALKDQQERSLPLEAQWALDLVDRDGIGFGGSSNFFGRKVTARMLYDDYEAYVRSRRRHPMSSVTFGKYLTRVGVDLQRTGSSRQRDMPTSDEFADLVRKAAGVHE